MVDSVAIRSHQTRRRAQDVFLLWAWLVVALSVVADIEPSPSDLGISLLFVQGVLCAS